MRKVFQVLYLGQVLYTPALNNVAIFTKFDYIMRIDIDIPGEKAIKKLIEYRKPILIGGAGLIGLGLLRSTLKEREKKKVISKLSDYLNIQALQSSKKLGQIEQPINEKRKQVLKVSTYPEY